MSTTTLDNQHDTDPHSPDTADLLLKHERCTEPCGLLPCGTLGAIGVGFAAYFAFGVSPLPIVLGMLLGFILGLWAGAGAKAE